MRPAISTIFAYNAQTADDQTEKLRDAAEKADVPVVDFTETLPENKDYVEWMTDNVSSVKEALTQ
jgi:zinc/manganese transport system substrate-binding protein